MLTERGANKSGGWGLGSSSSEWSTCRGAAGGELMRPKAVCSKEQYRPHVVGWCHPCGTCPATNRSGPYHLAAVVVGFGEGQAIPP